MSTHTVVCPGADLPAPLAIGKRRTYDPMPQQFALSICSRGPTLDEDTPGASFTVSAAFDERTVLIDLTEVTWVDSWGLALFIEASQRIEANGGSLIFFGVHDNLQRLFATTKLDQLFHIASSRDEALADGCRP